MRKISQARGACGASSLSEPADGLSECCVTHCHKWILLAAGAEVQQDFWAAELSAGAQQGAAGAPAESAATIASAFILDPYILVCLSDGNAALIEADSATGEAPFNAVLRLLLFCAWWRPRGFFVAISFFGFLLHGCILRAEVPQPAGRNDGSFWDPFAGRHVLGEASKQDLPLMLESFPAAPQAL